MIMFWPCTHPRILPSFVASQVCKKSYNMSSHGIVHYKLNKLSKSVPLTHLSSLESIFIHCGIFWLSFALDIRFFLIGFLTYSSTCALPFHFIIIFVPNLGHWRIMLKIGPFSKSYWKNTSPLLTSCYFSSTCLDLGTSYGCSWTTCWGPTSISSSKFVITIICGTSLL
jgi:hypothetical protein